MRVKLAGVNDRQASDLSKRVAIELRNARNRLGFLWADVEKTTGISHATMQRMLNGQVDIPINRLMLICEAIGVPATRIIEEATRHMPDGYIRDMLASPPVSPAPRSVSPIQETDWNHYEGKKAADTDEGTTHTTT